MGEEVGRFVREAFAADDVLSRLRQVQSIVMYLEAFPVERAEAACRRARFYQATSYQAVKNILLRALDLEPLPTTKTHEAWADSPRFARDPSDLVTRAKEVSDERH
jgi:hypothetical protein